MSGAWNYLWLIVLLVGLLPILRQNLLELARRRLIRRIESMRGSRVILLVHREETLGLLGIPVFRYIDIHDAESVIRAVRSTDPATPIDLVLHTPGGPQRDRSSAGWALPRGEGQPDRRRADPG